MHALIILHRCLGSLLSCVHRRRLETLFAATAACVTGPRLTLTDIGRRFATKANLRHSIKRADRLLGNTKLQGEVRTFYAALCRVMLARVVEPLILIDWSDLKADQSVHLLQASLAVGGRSLTLYEEVHPQKRLNNRGVQISFLRTLATLLPTSVKPIIIADSGFKVPFYREVERLGWSWVGRVRGRDFLRPKHHWLSCKTLFKRATQTPTSLGIGEWVRSNPLPAVMVLVRLPPQGRHGNNTFGKRARSKKSQQSARAAKEPWLLVASPKLAELPAKRLVKLYRQRMQIEESFRDMKSQHFGEGLECSRSSGVGRYTVLVLIGSLAAFLLWLLGTAAEQAGLHHQLYPSNRKRRIYSKLFLARLLLVLDRCRNELDRLTESITDVGRWIKSDHDTMLATETSSA
jgi:hypothetical protein